MQLSAEVRLFWFDNKPAALEDWFLKAPIHGCAAGGGKGRTDVYLRDGSQIELGVKTRGEKPGVEVKGVEVTGVEVKGLVSVQSDSAEFVSYNIPIEIWSKWSSRTLGFDAKAGVALHKTRWLRKFDTAEALPVEIALDSREQPVDGALPARGCNVEWTMVEIPSAETCWTLGFEAFGSLHDIESSLRSVVRLMNGRNPPDAPGATAASYPAWLAKRLPAREH
jgi:hypothetical protein